MTVVAVTRCQCLSPAENQLPSLLLNRRGLKDALDRGIQHGVEFTIRLLGRQSLEQCPRKARDDARVFSQACVSFFPRIPTRERQNPQHIRMPNEIGVKVVLLGRRKLEKDRVGGWQLAEL